MVDLGTETRQILSGVRMHYPDPSVLVGKQVPVVMNLAPRTIRGLESNGMILYAVGEGEDFTTLEPLKRFRQEQSFDNMFLFAKTAQGSCFQIT